MRQSSLDLASRTAERFLRERGVATVPIDPVAIAEALEIEVRPMPEAADGVSGMLLRHGNIFGIGYATHVSSRGFQRFSVAHELGHYVLPGHMDQVLGDGVHHSHAGFASKDRFELEADHFAAGLLMPESLFRGAMLRVGSGFAAIEALASQFECSLEAAAIRYARLSDEPVAIVVSTGDRAHYWFASEMFKRIPDITWIRKRDLLPPSSYTREFNKDPERVARCERWEQTSSVAEWFGDGPERELAARRLVLELDGGVLPVQGPPGAGKTYMGARMICELVRAGRKVGVTAVSHKVIRNLLDAVVEAAGDEGLDVQCLHKVSDRSDDLPDGIAETTTNPGLLKALTNGEAQVGAGTVWAWARPDFEGAVDVLVVDEAGQMSLANTLAASQAARSLVLLGDPQQLEQPIQGSHPEGADVSALEHLLEGHETISDERGLFLSETWRLHPTICEFTSQLFYEGRLGARPGREVQRLVGPTPFTGAGLWFAPVEHAGNQSSSPEEVDRVAELYASLLAGGATWIDPDGVEAPLSPADVLIVAPYNAQVGALSERLPEARVGTVDKFQGQEAPVVIYSMTTSAPEDAPRGMEFLYSLHRLNVATSRARCVCIIVGSPRLLEPECRTPHQMRLANALCRYVELARSAPGSEQIGARSEPSDASEKI